MDPAAGGGETPIHQNLRAVPPRAIWGSSQVNILRACDPSHFRYIQYTNCTCLYKKILKTSRNYNLHFVQLVPLNYFFRSVIPYQRYLSKHGYCKKNPVAVAK